MDNYYVTPDGQIAQLPKRSFFDRLTSGLYDATVEYRKPGGGQEARLARTQPLTSALNQYGQQKRSFDQEANMLGKTQEFSAGQNTLDRDNRWALADFEAGRRAEADRLRREQDAQQFQAVQGLNEAKRFDDIYNTNRKFIAEQELLPLQRQLTQSQIDENTAQAEAAKKLAEYRAMTSALERGELTPEVWAVAQALNPALATIPMPRMTYSQFGDVSRVRPGSSGTAVPDWLNPNNQPGARVPIQLRGTNAAPATLTLD